MRAFVLHGINQFRLEETGAPEPGAGEVLVAVKAAGICGSDIPRIYKNGTYSYPLIPGHEFAGEVVKLGENSDPAWMGKRVGVYPLIPCTQCGPCREHRYELCRNYSYLGSRANGGFAELICAPQWNLVALPDDVSFEQAAMLEPMSVAVHAMRGTYLQEKNSIVVCGLGTIGLLLLMFLMDRGYQNLYVIGNKEIQKRYAVELGLTENRFCDAGKMDVDSWIDKQTGSEGIDVFFDCAGQKQVLTWALNHTVPGGAVQLVGNPAFDSLEQALYWKILRKELTVRGFWNSSFTHAENDDWHYVLDRLRQGKIHPELLITHRYPFENLKAGFVMMREKREEFVKVMGVL